MAGFHVLPGLFVARECVDQDPWLWEGVLGVTLFGESRFQELSSFLSLQGLPVRGGGQLEWGQLGAPCGPRTSLTWIGGRDRLCVFV